MVYIHLCKDNHLFDVGDDDRNRERERHGECVLYIRRNITYCDGNRKKPILATAAKIGLYLCISSIY